jgi:hypothetical protein
MVRRAGVNKLHTTATQISVHIRDFRHDTNLLQIVKGLDEITHHTPLVREDEEWLIQNRMTFSVSKRASFPLPCGPQGVFFILVYVWYHRGAADFDVGA